MRSFRAALTLLGVALLSACNDEPAQPSSAAARAEKAVEVRLQQVTLAPEQVRLAAVGTSRAIRSVTLFPKSTGVVASLGFEAGAYVKQGEVLLQLDDRDERLAVELARVRLDEAERLYRRYQRSPKSVTPSDLDSAASAVDAARIELNRARVALDERSLKAPFSGHVGLADLDIGAHVDTTTAITTLDDRSALLVSFEVPEVLSGTLLQGDAVSLALWQQPQARFNGHIVELDSRIDPASRTFLARAKVPNPDDRLRPGMSFRLNLALDGTRYPVVPEVSVQWGNDGAYVWRVVDQRAQRVPITIVQRRKGEVLVDAALALGDQVVREGVQRMREGTLISANGNPATAAP